MTISPARLIITMGLGAASTTSRNRVSEAVFCSVSALGCGERFHRLLTPSPCEWHREQASPGRSSARFSIVRLTGTGANRPTPVQTYLSLPAWEAISDQAGGLARTLRC